MEQLSYNVSINASKSTVWDTLLDPITYRQWAKGFSPNSQFEGDWRQGSYMKFTDPNMGGTKAILETVVPHERIRARHVAMIDKDGREDAESEGAEKWVGTIEEYLLNEKGGITELTVEMQTHPDFVSMFAECWPKALDLLKGICEAGE